MGASLVSHRALAAVRGVTATLSRGSDTADVTVVLGTSEFESEDTEGRVFTTTTIDLILASEDYDFGSGPVVPAVGDKAVVGSITYQARVPSGAKVFDYMGHDEEMIRLHMSEVAG